MTTKSPAAQQQPLLERQAALVPAADGATQAIEPEKKADNKIDRRLPATNVGTLSKFLNQNANTLGEFATGFMKPESMIRMAQIAFSKSPVLAKCTLASILRSLMDAASLRVKPGGLNGR